MYTYEIVLSAICMILCGAFTVFCAVTSVVGEVSMAWGMYMGIVFMLITLGTVLYELYAGY